MKEAPENVILRMTTIGELTKFRYQIKLTKKDSQVNFMSSYDYHLLIS